LVAPPTTPDGQTIDSRHTYGTPGIRTLKGTIGFWGDSRGFGGGSVLIGVPASTNGVSGKELTGLAA